VRPSIDASYRNKRVSLKSNVKESLKLLHTKPSLFRKLVIKIINLERQIFMCQTELGLRQITQNSMLALELDLRCTI
jgi:hypothetical protein